MMLVEADKKIKVCGYCRVSTKSDDQANSFENQQMYFKQLTDKREDYEMVQIYADRGISGTSLSKRPEFNKMLQDAGLDIFDVKGEQVLIESDREPMFNRILVKNTSRLARNILVVDSLRKLANKGVYVDFLDIDKSSENESDSTLIQLLLSIDEENSRFKSRSVREGQRRGMERGVIPSAPLGYTKISKTELEINEEESEIVKLVFDLYVNHNKGIRQIVKILDEKGLKSRRGNLIGNSAIGKMLKQTIYKGTLIRGKRDYSGLFTKIDMINNINPESEWFITENHKGIPVIIDTETFNKAQDIINGRSNIGKSRGRRKSKSKYSSMLICGRCGSTYCANSDSSRKFYNCRTKREKGVDTCNAYNINESVLDQHIEDYAKYQYSEDVKRHIMYSTLKLKGFRKYIYDKRDNEIDFEKVTELEGLIAELNKRQDRAYDIYESGDMTKVKYLERKDSLDIEIEKKAIALRSVNRSKNECDTEIEIIDSTLERLKLIEIKNEYSKEEIMEEIDSITIDSMTPEEYQKLFGNNMTSKDEKLMYKRLRLEIKPYFKIQKLIADLMNKYHEMSEISSEVRNFN